MQLQFTFPALIRYIQSGEKLPVSIIEMSQSARNSQSEKDTPAATLIGIITCLVNLYSSIKGGGIADPAMIIQEALPFENELANWEAGLPASWNVKLCSLPNSKCDHRSHIDPWQARVTNHYRWARILVNDILLGHIIKLGLPATKDLVQLQSSRETIVRLATDLCTTISAIAQTCQYSIDDSTCPFSPQLPVFVQIWPLTVLGSAFGMPEELHNCVISILEKLGNTLGIRQALAVIPLIKLQREHWKRAILRTQWVRHENFAEFSVLDREILTV